MFWQPAFCSRNRKAKLAITLIQLLATRENSKEIKAHKIIFSFCFISAFPIRLNRPGSSLESAALFPLCVPTCLRAYVGEAAPPPRSLLCWGRINAFSAHLCSIWLCNILFNPCGGLFRGSASCVAAESLTGSACTFSPLLKSFSFSEGMDFQWPCSKTSQGMWRECTYQERLIRFLLWVFACTLQAELFYQLWLVSLLLQNCQSFV